MLREHCCEERGKTERMRKLHINVTITDIIGTKSVAASHAFFGFQAAVS
jgi:hypothetical protein